jgi:hypothetical protein
MSDFLSRLAGRSMGVEAVVRPAIPAMTAPSGAREPGLVEQEMFAEAAPVDAAEDRVAAVAEEQSPQRREAVSAPVTGMMTTELVAAPRGEASAVPLKIPVERESESRSREEDAEAAERTIPSWREQRPEAAASVRAIPATARAEERREAAAEAAPIVRVTIGRVEVRAELSAGKTRMAAPAKKSPSVSLDDYLKQRAEGRR